MRRYALLEEAIDLHVHSGPDGVSRYADGITTAREAAAAGMRAIVLKDHLSPSIVKSALVQQEVPEIEVLGGVTLNGPSGGLSVRSVEYGIAAGARVVWLPTVDSQAWCDRFQQHPVFLQYAYGQPVAPLPVLDADGETLLPAVEEILGLVARHDLVLSTGHLAPREALAVARRARALGVRRVMVEHPNSGYPDDFTPAVLDDLAQAGAYLNLAFQACQPLGGRRDPRDVVAIVRAVGAARCTLITDFGQPECPAPAEGLRVWMETVLKLGLNGAEVEQLVKINPANLLGLAGSDLPHAPTGR